MAINGCRHPGGRQLTVQLWMKSGLTTGQKCLDAGCGQGLTVEFLREKQLEAYGIDHCPPADKPYCQQGDLLQLPYADGSFAGIFSECSLAVCGNPAAALAEYYRVLQPAGRLCLADVYFTGEMIPCFNDGRQMTLGSWQVLLQEQGFSLLQWEEATEYWKPYVLEQLWAGYTLEELWGNCQLLRQLGGKGNQVGYWLCWAEKG